MAVEIVMPRLGWTMQEGTLVEWSKRHGEAIDVGEIVMLVESDKAVNEVEVFDAGTLHIPADSPPPGSTIPVGAVMAYILAPDESAPVATARSVAPPPPEPAASVAAAAPPPADQPQPAMRERSRATSAPTISPRARRLAEASGVDWQSLQGSGRTGRIVERDVEAAAAGSQGGAGMTHSATVAVEADATEFVQLHEKLSSSRNVAAEEMPTMTDLLVKLSAVALALHPDANIATVDESGCIEVARAVPDGARFAYPVISDAAAKSLRQIAAESRLIESPERQPEEKTFARGTTFAVIDMGPYGVDSFQPSLGPHQRAALAAGRPVSRPGPGGVGVRLYLALNLTFNPEDLDGIAVSAFLSTVREFIQEPYQWLTW